MSAYRLHRFQGYGAAKRSTVIRSRKSQNVGANDYLARTRDAATVWNVDKFAIVRAAIVPLDNSAGTGAHGPRNGGRKRQHEHPMRRMPRSDHQPAPVDL